MNLISFPSKCFCKYGANVFLVLDYGIIRLFVVLSRIIQFNLLPLALFTNRKVSYLCKAIPSAYANQN